MKYVSVEEMIAIEKESDGRGHTYPEMMERAGSGLAEVVHERYGKDTRKRAAALVGSGNNGGDALVALDVLQGRGWKTTALIVRDRGRDCPLVDRVRRAGGWMIDLTTKEDPRRAVSRVLGSCDVLLDGVLGTGIRLPVRGQLGEFLDLVHLELEGMENPPAVVAVDCPSGMDADSGEVDPCCIPAQLTVTMAAVKQGLLKFPAYDYLGELRCVGIGLPEGLQSVRSVQREVVFAEKVRAVLLPRSAQSHKGTYGTALVIAGSILYPGASLLAGEAAYRSGVGLVTIAVPGVLHPHLAGHLPEATWLPLSDREGYFGENAADGLRESLGKASAVLLGPGLGLHPATGEFVSRFLEGEECPALVVDADGLRQLVSLSDWEKRLPPRTVLTPHPGEMEAMTGLATAEIQAERVKAAEEYSARWGHVVVLKGAHTVIADPDGRTDLIPIAHPSLASAGTGDVLAGMITGLIAQGMDCFSAASSAAWMHARAGIQAAKALGSPRPVAAGDVCRAIPAVFAELENMPLVERDRE